MVDLSESPHYKFLGRRRNLRDLCAEEGQILLRRKPDVRVVEPTHHTVPRVDP